MTRVGRSPTWLASWGVRGPALLIGAGLRPSIVAAGAGHCANAHSALRWTGTGSVTSYRSRVRSARIGLTRSPKPLPITGWAMPEGALPQQVGQPPGTHVGRRAGPRRCRFNGVKDPGVDSCPVRVPAGTGGRPQNAAARGWRPISAMVRPVHCGHLAVQLVGSDASSVGFPSGPVGVQQVAFGYDALAGTFAATGPRFRLSSSTAASRSTRSSSGRVVGAYCPEKLSDDACRWGCGSSCSAPECSCSRTPAEPAAAPPVATVARHR